MFRLALIPGISTRDGLVDSLGPGAENPEYPSKLAMGPPSLCLTRTRQLKLLEMLPKWLRDGLPGSAGSSDTGGDPRDRRAAPRFDVDQAVSLIRPGFLPAAGLVFNISRSGAAIRIHGIQAPVPAPWPARLKHGDEISLLGLLTNPVSCWVVGVEDGVLRVHFSLDAANRRQLGAKIATLSRT